MALAVGHERGAWLAAWVAASYLAPAAWALTCNTPGAIANTPDCVADPTCLDQAAWRLPYCQQLRNEDMPEVPTHPQWEAMMSNLCCHYCGTTAMMLLNSFPGVTHSGDTTVVDPSSPSFQTHAALWNNCTGSVLVMDYSASPSLIQEDVGFNDMSNSGAGIYDAYMVKASWVADLWQGLENLSPRLGEEPAIYWADVAAGQRSSSTYNSSVRVLPLDGDTQQMLYRTDLLRQHGKAQPKTLEEFVELAEYFHGRDLNGDGEPDFGICLEQFFGFKFYAALLSATAAQYIQPDPTRGTFFDTRTFVPTFNSSAFRKAFSLVARMMAVRGDEDRQWHAFQLGRCFALPGYPGQVKVPSKSGAIRRYDDEGSTLWEPLHDGAYDAPTRVLWPGSREVLDWEAVDAGAALSDVGMVPCTEHRCPHALGVDEDEGVELDVSHPGAYQSFGPYTGINRAPFWPEGGYGIALRRSPNAEKKALVWHFMAYHYSPEISRKWATGRPILDQHRGSHVCMNVDPTSTSTCATRQYYIDGGYGDKAIHDLFRVSQQTFVHGNPALDLRVPGYFDYFRAYVETVQAAFEAPLCAEYAEVNQSSMCNQAGAVPRAEQATFQCTARGKAVSCTRPYTPSEFQAVVAAKTEAFIQRVVIRWAQITQAKGGVFAQLAAYRASLGMPHYIPGCEPGEFFDTGVGVCVRCAAGTYSVGGEVGRGSLCLACPAGSYCPEGAAFPVPCQRGNYSGAGAGECTRCAAGTYGHQAAMSECVQCTKGMYAAEEGRTECDPCGLGAYNPDVGQTACSPCGDVIVGSTTLSFHASSPEQCVCQVGKFVHAANSAAGRACVPCVEGTVCPGGRARPLQQEGYYAEAPDNASRPHLVVKCRSGTECPGLTPLGTCPPHHGGLACSRCETNHYQDGDGRCVSCTGSFSGMGVAASFLAALAMILLMVLFATKQAAVQRQTTITVVLSFSLIVNSLQIIGAFGELSISWVQPVKTFKELLSLLTWRIDFLKPGCIFMTDAPEVKYLGEVLVYPLFAALLTAVFGAAKLLGKKVTRVEVINAHGLVLLVMFLSLTMISLLPWQCKLNPDGSSSLATSRGVLCWEPGAHWTMIGLSAVAIVAFICTFLSLVTWAILVYPARVEGEGGIAFLQTFKFLFARFRPEVYYYGLPYTLRSVFIAVTPIFLVNVPAAQILLMALLVIGSGIVQARIKPWRTNDANTLDVLLSMSLALMLVAGSMLLETERREAEIVLQGFLMAILGLMVLVVLLISGHNAHRMLIPPKRFGVFLCHHKAGAGVLARHMKMMLAPHVAERVFLDSDELENLDILFDIVAGDTRNLVALLTKQTLTRHWCAGEIATAVKADVNVVKVVCDDFVPVTPAFIDSVPALWTEAQQTEIGRLGVDLTSVQLAYDALAEVPEVRLRRGADDAETSRTLESVLKRCTGLHDSVMARRLSGCRDGASIKAQAQLLILGNSQDAEAVVICQVLRHYLTQRIQAGVLVVGSQKSVDPEEYPMAKYLLVVLTRGTLQNPFVAHSVVSLRSSGMEMIPVHADFHFEFPSSQFWEDLQLGKVVQPGAAELGAVRIAAVEKAYKALFAVLAVSFSPHSCDRIQICEVGEIVPRLHDLHKDKQRVPIADPVDLDDGTGSEAFLALKVEDEPSEILCVDRLADSV